MRWNYFRNFIHLKFHMVVSRPIMYGQAHHVAYYTSVLYRNIIEISSQGLRPWSWVGLNFKPERLISIWWFRLFLIKCITKLISCIHFYTIIIILNKNIQSNDLKRSCNGFQLVVMDNKCPCFSRWSKYESQFQTHQIFSATKIQICANSVPDIWNYGWRPGDEPIFCVLMHIESIEWHCYCVLLFCYRTEPSIE